MVSIDKARHTVAQRRRNTLLIALSSVTIGWLASDIFSDRYEPFGLPEETTTDDTLPELAPSPGNGADAPSFAPEDSANVIAVEEITGLVPVIVAPPPSDAGEPEAIALPPANTPVAELRPNIDRPIEAESPDDVAEAILSSLLAPADVYCEFGIGNGANWPNATLNVYEAEWQGGPVSFQAVNLDAGTAQMAGTVDATDSLTGTIAARVIPTASGLHFLALTPNGYLITATVFGERDETGRFIAVMSRHEGEVGQIYTTGTQFYGVCG